VIVFFTRRRVELERRLPVLRSALDPAGGLWIAGRRRRRESRPTSSSSTSRRSLANRLVDNKTCAIDETWSGARMVIRLEDRPD
jgi:hypothetical protein